MSFLSRLFNKNSVKYWVMIAVFLASSWPLLQPSIFKIHDFTHGARIAEMLRALQDGHFPVRWSQNFGYGYGMPLFQFYGPLPFYIGAIFYWLTNSLVGSVKFIFLVANFFSLLGSYLLGKKLFKTDLASIITSLAFSLAPYRFLNLYVRGAVNELWGMMALPWVVWGALKIIKQERWGWLSLTLSLSILFLSHNISTMIFSPFIIGVILLLLFFEFFETKSSIANFKKSFKTIIGSGLMATGLSAFYLFPAYLEKGFTQVERFILAEYFDFRIHFLYLRQFFQPNWGFGGSEYGPNDPVTFFLGYGQILSLLLTIFLIFFLSFQVVIKKNKLDKKNLYFILGIMILFLIVIFLTLPWSEFFWHSIAPLRFAQFPWRFLGIGSFLLSMIAGWSLQQTRQYHTLNIIAVIVLLSTLLLNLRFVHPEEFLDNPSDYYYSNAEKIRSEMSATLPDYIPTDLDLRLPPAENLIINAGSYPLDNLMVTVDKTHQKELRFNEKLEKPVELELAIAHYPGWQTHNQAELTTSKNGLILLKVPPGHQTVGLRFSNTNLRRLSDALSAVTLLLVILWSFKMKNIGKIKEINFKK